MKDLNNNLSLPFLVKNRAELGLSGLPDVCMVVAATIKLVTFVVFIFFLLNRHPEAPANPKVALKGVNA
jgi:hypothetical protein